LEEPSGPVVFLLVCYNLHELILTIVSRCQQLLFSADSKTYTQTMSWLWEQTQASDTDLLLAMRQANAAPLRAMQLLEDGYVAFRHQVITHLMQCADATSSPLNCAMAWIKQDIREIFHIWMGLVLDLMKVLHTVPTDCILNQDQMQQLQVWAQQMSVTALACFSELLLEAKALSSAMLNLNQQLLLEKILISWRRLFSHIPKFASGILLSSPLGERLGEGDGGG